MILAIGDVRQQEQGGRIVPIRRITVCCPDGGKIYDWAAVQALERLKSSNTHEDSKSGYTAAWIAPFNTQTFAVMHNEGLARHIW